MEKETLKEAIENESKELLFGTIIALAFLVGAVNLAMPVLDNGLRFKDAGTTALFLIGCFMYLTVLRIIIMLFKSRKKINQLQNRLKQAEASQTDEKKTDVP